MTLLHVYGTKQVSSIVSTASKLSTATGGTDSYVDIVIGSSTGWGELWSQGRESTVWQQLSAIGAPTDHGWILDDNTLSGQTIASGTWTPAFSFHLELAATITADFVARAYVRHSNGSKTLIGTWTTTGQTITGINTVYTPVPTSASSASFSNTDHLYIDAWLNITSNTGGNNFQEIRLHVGDTAGVTNDVDLNTPGYGIANPILSTVPGTLAFTAVANGASPATKTSVLSEIGGGTGSAWTSTISYSGTPGWLGISPVSGTLAAGGAQTVVFTATTGALPSGTYQATVTYTATTGGSTAQVIVTFKVIAPQTPHIATSKGLLSYSALVTSASPPSQSVVLSETNGAQTAWISSISYTIGSGWLSLSPTQGNYIDRVFGSTLLINTLPPLGFATVAFTCSSNLLPVGVYLANVTFTATTGGSTVVVVVQLIVTPLPPPPPPPNSILMAGQNITPYVDQLSIQIEDTLGQGAGAGSAIGAQGRASTIKFNTNLGPLGSALGAGQVIPPVTTNLYPAGTATGASVVGTTIAAGSTAVVDNTQAFEGKSSIKIGFNSISPYEAVNWLLPISNFLPNTTYAFSLYATGTGFLNIRAVGSTIIYASGPPFTLTSSWASYSIIFTTPAVFTETQLGLRLDTDGIAQTTTFNVDGIQAEQSLCVTDFHVGTNPGVLVRQGEIIVTDANGLRIFGGFATKLTDTTTTELGLSMTPFTQVEGVDYSTSLARTFVNDALLPMTDVQTLQYIFSTYAPWINLSLLPATGTFNFPATVYRNISVEQVAQTVADITGFMVWIDYYKVLHYTLPSGVDSSPFTLSDQPDFVTSFPHAVTEYTTDDTAAINRVFFSGGKRLSNDFTQELTPQANGTNRVFILAYAPSPTSDGTYHVTVSGNERLVGVAGAPGAANILIANGGTAQVLVDPANSNLTFDAGFVPGNAVPTFAKYKFSNPLVIEVTDEASHKFYGPPYLDGTITDPSVTDFTTAIQRSKVLLLEQSFGLTTLKLDIYRPGLQAGQVVQVNNAVRGINNTFIIQEVKIDPLGNGNYIYHISAGAWNWNLIDILVKLAAGVNLANTTQAETAGLLILQQAGHNIQVSTSAFCCPGLGYAMRALTGPLPIRLSGPYYARSAFVGDSHDAFPGFSTVTS